MTDGATDAMPLRSIRPHPDLEVVTVYEREVEASIDSVWENALDWEHLPWLHAQAFSTIELRAAGEWGWHAQVGFAGGAKAEIELVVDRAQSRYVARTRSGAGAPSEIWTRLDPVTSETTAIRVEFRTSPLSEEIRSQLAMTYRALYAGLWDQDEGMMRSRAVAKATRGDRAVSHAGGVEETSLGDEGSLRARLPLVVAHAGERFRVVEWEGRLVAHSTECPHWLGPLDACPIDSGILTCPWHGYRFDVVTGRSVEGRGLRLRKSPRVVIDPRTSEVRLASTPDDSDE